jgi:hypothetical protein
MICNTTEASTFRQVSTASDAPLYLSSERHIEAGAAYFGQAFTEALSLISDIELHNPQGAELRLQSITSLLDCALRQYETAMESGSKSKLIEYHERKLLQGGLDPKGIRQVLDAAHSRGFLMQDDERIETLTATFVETGYSGLMSLYTGKVQDIRDLAVTMSESTKPEDNAVAWQELGWKLSTLFAQTLEIGKAIAILNTLTFRLPLSMVASATTRA